MSAASARCSPTPRPDGAARTGRRLFAFLLSSVFAACGTNVDLGGQADGAPADRASADGTSPDGTMDARADAEIETSADAIECPGLADPHTPAQCNACDPQFRDCQTNGCYNGWYCNVASRYCEPPPTTCDAGSYDSGFFYDGGFFD